MIKFVFTMKILAQDRSGRYRIAVADLQRADHAALPSQENRLLVQQHPARHVPHQRRSCFVAVRRKVKMDIGTADLAVIATAGAAGHEAVAKIDQAAQGHERKQNGVLQPDAVRAGGFLLKDTGLAHLRARTHAGFLQENRLGKRTALQLDLRPDLAVINRYRAFAPEHSAGCNHGLVAIQTRARIQHDIVARDGIDVHLIADIQTERIGNADTLCNQGPDFFFRTRLKFHGEHPLQ